MSKCRKLRELLKSDKLEFLMEAHSGISAVIAEEAGFKGLWASGLSVSAMTGCRDRNELDLSEVCKVIEWMADHTSLPILVDGDTGGVDVNSARIMVNKLIKAGAAGVCIEDKLFPKHNSFHSNGTDDLADPELHCAKIRAMKKESSDFVVVARLEEFIAGVGVEEAFRRANLYVKAGADAILVHSKIKDSSEIDSFMKMWNSEVPIIIVPTKYYSVPTSHFKDIGVSTIIWANHSMRASIKAMQDTVERIYEDQSLLNVEDKIAPVSEVFRLQRDDDLFAKEMTSGTSEGQAIILSAVCDKSQSIPKSLIEVRGKTILDYQLEAFSSLGLVPEDVSLVVGEKFEDFESARPTLINNSRWESSTEVTSMKLGLIQDSRLPAFISYGDLVFKKYVLDKLGDEGDIVLAVDPEYVFSSYNEWIVGDKEYNKLSLDDTFKVKDASEIRDKDASGVFIGLLKVNTAKGYYCLRKALYEAEASGSDKRFVYALRKLLDEESSCRCDVRGVYITEDSWVDVNEEKDIIKASELK